MDNELLLKQLVRQMRWLNIWVSFFGIVIIIAMVAAGILMYKAVSYIHEGQQQISNIQKSTSQTLDVKSNLCKSNLGTYLNKDSTYCK